MMQEDLVKYMEEALILARLALNSGNPPVGAVLISENEVIGKGVESGKSTGDITNHAEILAIRNVINRGFQEKLINCSLYTTHEPCIMCSYLIRHYKIPQIIYGASVDYVGGFSSDFNILSTKQVPKWGKPPTVRRGILESDCEALSKQFSMLIKS